MYRTLPRRFPQLRGHVRVMLCHAGHARANAADGMTAFEKRYRDSCPGPVMSFIYHNRQPDALTQPLRAFFSLRPTGSQTHQAAADQGSAERHRQNIEHAAASRSVSTSCWHSGTAVAAPEAHVSSTLCVLTHRRRPDQAAAVHGSQLVWPSLSWNVPAGHFSHTSCLVALLKVPAAHGVAFALPTGQ